MPTDFGANAPDPWSLQPISPVQDALSLANQRLVEAGAWLQEALGRSEGSTADSIRALQSTVKGVRNDLEKLR